MKLNKSTYLAVLTLAVIGGYLVTPQDTSLKSAATWQSLASPGALSAAHAHLERNCAACHTPVKGATPLKCVLCHATATDVLQRQPTAFHGSITSCKQCHSEHRGFARRPTEMSHEALTRIGLDALARATSEDQDSLHNFLQRNVRAEGLGAQHAHLTSLEASLSCASCHSKEDQHFGLFGLDCGECHSTAEWTLPAFRHPSATSRDCAQCHQAPPSHYKMHFKMVSAKVARQPHATVEQCFKCHRTTAWTDIPGIGHYKHH